ncbi:MAG: PEP-utilizing enzyme [bacterium]
MREAVKFEFTKNLSAAMRLLVEFGEYHGLDREALSFLPIESYLGLANRSASGDWISGARETIERHRVRYELTAAINLPDLIFSTDDTEVISLQRRRPNFVTQKRIVARAVTLSHDDDLDRLPDLKGALVLIENADPGFDWLFARGIGGLLTKHGGAASHMTIRCAELGLPAAIGCGEQIFEELSRANSILLDCAERRVEPHAA